MFHPPTSMKRAHLFCHGPKQATQQVEARIQTTNAKKSWAFDDKNLEFLFLSVGSPSGCLGMGRWEGGPTWDMIFTGNEDELGFHKIWEGICFHGVSSVTSLLALGLVLTSKGSAFNVVATVDAAAGVNNFMKLKTTPGRLFANALQRSSKNSNWR